MGQRAITIYTPESTDPHITADDDAFIYRMLFGADSGILGGLTCVKVNDNTVRLSGGGVSNRGHILRIPDGETLELTVNSGTAGYKRYDSIVAEFVRGGGNDADEYQIKAVQGTAVTGTPAVPTMTTTGLLNKGNVNQVELFRLYFSGTSLLDIIQIAQNLTGHYSSSNAATGTDTSSGSTSTSGSSNASSTSTGTSSGILVEKVSSTVSSPSVHYSARYEASKNGSNLSVKLTFAAWLNSGGSKLGTGAKLTVFARINGGAWQSVVIKKTSESWSGTSQHSAALTLTTASSGTATVEFYVTRNGSTYSGTAGNLASAASPKEYTVKMG